MRKIIIFIAVAVFVAIILQRLIPNAQESLKAAAPKVAVAGPAVLAGKLQILPDGGAALVNGSCHVHGLLPDARCSPGAISRATTANVCTRGWAGRHRNLPESEKRAIYAEYGIAAHTGATYEMDHIVSLELGGDNNVRNLYPEAAPAFHEKDKVENAAHRAVCAGKLPLATAQRQIASDWTKLRYLAK